MLILAMSISGSVVFLAVFLCAVLGKRILPPAWAYNMMKIALVFFCIPLPKYNSGYKNVLFNRLGVPKRWDMTDITLTNFIGVEESGRLHINFQTYILVMWAVWACGLLFVGVKNMYTFQKLKALKENPQISQTNYLAIFDRVKQEVGIKKNIPLLCADVFDTICTMGVFRKYVIIPEEGLTEDEIYFSLKHELIHVKRSDVAWKYISLLAVLLHWFNPLVYLYFRVMSIYSEHSCDAILVQDLDTEKRKRYGEIIIDMSGEGRWTESKHQASFSTGKIMVEWRLKSMLRSRKSKKIERVVSLLLGAVILFGGSLTVCAYENPQVVRGKANLFEISSNEEVVKTFAVEEIGYSEEAELDYREFLGDDGISYDLPEEQSSNMERAGCIHSFVSGTLKDHRKYSDGSCKTDYYRAEMCKICGEIRVKEYSHTETSTKCTH